MGYVNAYGGGYDQLVDMDYYEDDDSQEFRDLWQQTENGVVVA